MSTVLCKIFLCFFMSLLKGPFAKNTFWLNLLDLFKKNVLHQTFKSFNTTFGPR